MLKQYHHFLGGFSRLADAAIMVGAWLVSYWVRFDVELFFAVTKGLPDFETYTALTPLIAVLWMSVFTLMRIYESHRLLELRNELLLVLRAHLFALLCFVALTYGFRQYTYSRLVILYFAAISAFALTSFRLVVRGVLRAARARGYNLRHVLVVGEGATAEALIAHFDALPELGLRVVGVVTHETSQIDAIRSHQVLGHFGELSDTIERTRPDQVVIALPPAQQSETERVLDSLRDETVDVRLVPDLQRHVALGCEVETFLGIPIVRLNDTPLAGWGAIAKRATDILLASIALVVLSHVLLIIAALIKLTSPGPVLFVQERMGLDGRSFLMLKFRSMRVDAEAVTGAVWARPSDDRRTRFGAFLRRTSLDELPQLWNVLRGDMSLVGPRPERPIFVRRFCNQIPHYMLRHKVKAGITGWAQVNGWRGDTSLESRIQCDLFYIKNWSYLLDLKILTMTLWKGFVHKNAY
jgi:Undecaprenyl-phosphate glucose phosphotransferase